MVVSKNIVSPTDLTALHARGVHFVLCRDKDEGDKKAKSALASGWQKRRHPSKKCWPIIEQADSWVSFRGAVGFGFWT